MGLCEVRHSQGEVSFSSSGLFCVYSKQDFWIHIPQSNPNSWLEHHAVVLVRRNKRSWHCIMCWNNSVSSERFLGMFLKNTRRTSHITSTLNSKECPIECYSCCAPVTHFKQCHLQSNTWLHPAASASSRTPVPARSQKHFYLFQRVNKWFSNFLMIPLIFTPIFLHASLQWHCLLHMCFITIMGWYMFKQWDFLVTHFIEYCVYEDKNTTVGGNRPIILIIHWRHDKILWLQSTSNQ